MAVRVPVSALVISGDEGVYWIGVHVLGANAAGVRDDLADGRARSFIPLVDPGAHAVSTSLVLPLRRAVQRNADGRLTGDDEWTGELARVAGWRTCLVRPLRRRPRRSPC